MTTTKLGPLIDWRGSVESRSSRVGSAGDGIGQRLAAPVAPPLPPPEHTGGGRPKETETHVSVLHAMLWTTALAGYLRRQEAMESGHNHLRGLYCTQCRPRR